MSVTEKLKVFQAEWDGASLPIQDVVQRLQNGNYPHSLTVFHPRKGTLTFATFGTGEYLVFRMGPPLNGIRGGVARTFGNIVLPAKYILNHIDDVFNNISNDINLQKRASAKLLRMQGDAVGKMMNKSESYIPREVRDNILDMMGIPKPVKGAYNVPNSLSKINTTLFSNGGKRKSRRQKRNTTRRRR